MRTFDLSRLTNPRLQHGLATLAVEECERTALLLAHIAEFSARKLYAAAGYSSMHAYCVGQLGFTDDAAYNRIHAARAARRFPALFHAVADGELHVTAVRMLAPHLTHENLKELMAAAARRSKREVRRELIRRFGVVAVVPTVVEPRDRAQAARVEQLVPERVPEAPARLDAHLPEPAAGVVAAAAPAAAELVPEQVEHFRLHVTIEGATYDKLRRAQQLLGHSVPAGNVAAVLDRALDALIEQVEKRKFAATTRPRRSSKPSANRRHIPANVIREVRRRDGGRCTFADPSGTVCGSRRSLEFDHIVPIAHGGESTVENLRLRCRTHNQLEAERLMGEQFMKEKRDEAMRQRAELPAPAPEPPVPPTP